MPTVAVKELVLGKLLRYETKQGVVHSQFQGHNFEMFSDALNLKKHIASIHEGKKPFECNRCNTMFSQKGNLEKHIASVHEKKKPFECSIWNAKFGRKAHLNAHIKSVHE